MSNISLMLRLVERGFLRTEKNGKERDYYPLVKKEDYLQFETKKFMKLYHDNSFVSFANAVNKGKALDNADVNELLKWAEEQEE